MSNKVIISLIEFQIKNKKTKGFEKWNQNLNLG